MIEAILLALVFVMAVANVALAMVVVRTTGRKKVKKRITPQHVHAGNVSELEEAEDDIEHNEAVQDDGGGCFRF